MEFLRRMLDLFTVPIVALIVVIAQWKTVRALNAVNNMLIYYGKQIEEIRRLVSSGATAAAKDAPAAETPRRMYEILVEPEDNAKGRERPAPKKP